MNNDFNKRFGLKEPSVEEVREKFVNRVNSYLFSWIDQNDFFPTLFVPWISLKSGTSWDQRFRESVHGGYSDFSLRVITGDDFLKTLQVIEWTYEFLLANEPLSDFHSSGLRYEDRVLTTQYFEIKLKEILLQSEYNLGIFWKDGKFYPAGAEELDEALIKDNLGWMEAFPDAKLRYKTSLAHYKESLTNISARKDAITNAYSALESLARIILKNKNNFDTNSNEIVDYLGLSKEYKNIFHYYKVIANEYSSRHAGSDFTSAETEAFIYMTGLLIRLLIQKQS